MFFKNIVGHSCRAVASQLQDHGFESGLWKRQKTRLKRYREKVISKVNAKGSSVVLDRLSNHVTLFSSETLSIIDLP